MQSSRLLPGLPRPRITSFLFVTGLVFILVHFLFVAAALCSGERENGFRKWKTALHLNFYSLKNGQKLQEKTFHFYFHSKASAMEILIRNGTQQSYFGKKLKEFTAHLRAQADIPDRHHHHQPPCPPHPHEHGLLGFHDCCRVKC